MSSASRTGLLLRFDYLDTLAAFANRLSGCPIFTEAEVCDCIGRVPLLL
jgi:hypothetical protein